MQLETTLKAVEKSQGNKRARKVQNGGGPFSHSIAVTDPFYIWDRLPQDPVVGHIFFRRSIFYGDMATKASQNATLSLSANG